MINEAAQWTTMAIMAMYIAVHYRTNYRVSSKIAKAVDDLNERTESLNRTCGYLLEMIKDLRRAYGK